MKSTTCIICLSIFLDGPDYTSISNEVTFAAETNSTSIRVNITNDTVIERDEVFSAFLTSFELNVVLINSTASVTIIDNDGEYTLL